MYNIRKAFILLKQPIIFSNMNKISKNSIKQILVIEKRWENNQVHWQMVISLKTFFLKTKRNSVLSKNKNIQKHELN